MYLEIISNYVLKSNYVPNKEQRKNILILKNIQRKYVNNQKCELLIFHNNQENVFILVFYFLLDKRLFLLHFLLSLQDNSIGCETNSNFRFSTELYVLEGPEHDLTVFRECLSVNLSVSNRTFAGALSQERT